MEQFKNSLNLDMKYRNICSLFNTWEDDKFYNYFQENTDDDYACEIKLKDHKIYYTEFYHPQIYKTIERILNNYYDSFID